MKRTIHNVISRYLRTSAWIRRRRKFECPLRSDRLLWINPDTIEHKPANPPPKKKIPPTVLADGDWDQDLLPITDDIVYRSFHDRFVVGKSWKETEYVNFLRTEASEHGGLSVDEAMRRCQKLDDLYSSIKENGYRTQRELQRNGDLIDDLRVSRLRPPVYREISVDVTRDGEFVWHGGMHRLVIAKLLGLKEIPVRVHIRHEQWQEKRDAVYNGEGYERYKDHPDVSYLV